MAKSPSRSKRQNLRRSGSGSGSGSDSSRTARAGRLVVVTGIPGVGKTTVLTAAMELCREQGISALLVNYGDQMFESAKSKCLVQSRDEMRRLPVSEQVALQMEAAERICEIAAKGTVILDTHMFIRTPRGYMPGIPSWVAEILRPDSLVLVEADPAEVSKRRLKDAAIRSREADSPEKVTEHQMLGRGGAAALSVMTGCTVAIAYNREGDVRAAASTIVDLLR